MALASRCLPNDLMSSSSPSSPHHVQPLNVAARLPSEVLFKVFAYLEDPPDLYRASLACRSWHSRAIEPRLWERHYSRFYRASGEREDPLRRWQEHRRHEAMRRWLDGLPSPAAASGEPSTYTAWTSRPSFLDYAFHAPTPDFHSFFATRMNSDQRLLNSLIRLVQRQAGILDDMLQLVAAYNDQGRDLLAAFAASQKVTQADLSLFASQKGDKELRLRAIDVHNHAAAGRPQPDARHCLSLQYVARQLLAHIQRRDTIRFMRALDDRWTQSDPEAGPLRERVLRNSVGVEEGLELFALFGQGAKCELSHSLDILALYVWAKVTHADSPEVSTRQKMRNIIEVLRSLKFGLVSDDDWDDPNHGFPNVVLSCADYRSTHDYMLLAILCAVARRLGIAATLLSMSTMPRGFLALVSEDGGEEPADWPKGKEWDHFYVQPIFEGDAILELDGAKVLLAAAYRCSIGDAAVERGLTRTSPWKILIHAAVFFWSIVQSDRHRDDGNPWGDGPGGPNQALSHQEATRTTSRGAGLAALEDYLAGHATSPPSPLAPALLTSSLAFLPPTRPTGAPRAKSRALRKDSEGIMAWFYRIMDPDHVGGPRRSNDHIIKTCIGNEASSGDHPLDLALLLEVNGGNLQEELTLARNGGPPDDEKEVLLSPYGYDDLPSHPTPGLRRLAAKMLELDRLPCSAKEELSAEKRHGTEEGALASLKIDDARLPASQQAKYSIGTVFKHKTQGYYGAVIGRDSACRAPDYWIARDGVDALPGGGREQPFYNVIVAHDESQRYIAQCNIEPVRLLLSSKREAATVWRELLSLFNQRAVGRLFRTASFVAGDGVESESLERAELAGEEVEVKLVMNERTRQAWPYD